MSTDRQKVIDSAQKFAAKGQFDKAIAEYLRVAREDPSDVRVLLKIGDLQVRKGAKDEAVATYSRVAEEYEQQGLFLKSVAVYKQILSIDPNLTELYSKLAALYVKLGLTPDALAHLDALAGRYARAGQDSKVIEVYEKMVQIDATSVPAHIKLAELLSRIGRTEDAAREFEVGARLLRDARRIEDWAKVAERLLFHRPTDSPLARELAAFYLTRQDAKRALPKLQVCFKANPRDVDTLEMLGQAFRELGQLPKTVSVYKEIAKIHAEAGRTERRFEMLRKVLEIEPDDAEAREALKTAPAPEPVVEAPRKPALQPRAPEAQAAADAEISYEAEEESVEELEVDSEPAAAPPPRTPSRPTVEPAPASQSVAPPADVLRLIAEADVFVKYGLRQKALAHLNVALVAEPANLEIHVRLRDLYTESGDVSAAARHSVAAAELVAPSDPDAAVAELAHALQLDPDNGAGIELYTQLTGQSPFATSDEGFTDPGAAPASAGTDIEGALDEAEFFVTQGMYDDARDTLAALLEAHPGHRLVVERLEELEAMLQAQAEPGNDASFALAQKLAEEVEHVEGASEMAETSGRDMLDVDGVFQQFKRGIEQTVGQDDAETHYDLGIAYREMGLVDDAINEFVVAARNPAKQCLASMMVGMCLVEKGETAAAIEHFKYALAAPGLSDREETGLYFELGAAHEAVQQTTEALYYFQKVERRDPNFRGVRARIERLSSSSASGARPQPGAENVDDVDRAFDDLLKG